MELKAGVSVSGARPEIILAMHIVWAFLLSLKLGFVITAVTDGKHSVGSLHYVGLAFDFRLPTSDKKLLQDIALNLKARLGAEFDVVLEVDHFHIEYQPKQNRG